MHPPNLHNEPAYFPCESWVSITPAGVAPGWISIHSPFLKMPLYFSLWWCFREHEGNGCSALLCRCSVVAVALERSHLKEVPGSKPSGT